MYVFMLFAQPNVGSNTAVTEKSYKQRGSELVPTHKSAQSKVWHFSSYNATRHKN